MSKICEGRVVVIGAGIAGLAAADHLFKHGFHTVTILEAENRIGGRIHTIPYGKGTLELGAQWIHGEVENPLYKYALEKGLVNNDNQLQFAEGQGQYYTENGQLIDPALVKDMQQIMESADDDCAELFNAAEDGNHSQIKGKAFPISVEDFFEERFYSYLANCSDPPHIKKLREGLYQWYLTFQCLDNACYSMQQVSAATWGEFQYYDGRHWININPGYNSICQAVSSAIPKGRILTNKCVTSIEWDGHFHTPKKSTSGNGFITDNMHCHEASCAFNNGLQDSSKNECETDSFPIKIECKDGTVYYADNIIITMSLGVLKNSHRELFKPNLPAAKKRIIECMGFGTLNKIFLIFDKPFWESSTEGFQLIWTDEKTEIVHAEMKGRTIPTGSYHHLYATFF